jgi:hypothetical protein
MRAISELKQLKSLDISNTNISNEGFSLIRGLKNLEVLNIQFTKIDGDGLRNLESLKVRDLSICLNPEEISKLKLLSGQKYLRALTLKTGKLSDADMEIFGSLPRLHILTIIGGDLSNRQRKFLEETGRFKHVNLLIGRGDS